MRFFHFSAALIIPLALALAACDDPAAFRFDPVIVSDTVELAAPSVGNDAIPSALDIVAAGGVIGGGRFPERPLDSAEWDVAVRMQGGALVWLPAGAARLESPLLRRAAITPPITDRSFDQLNEAPVSSRFVSDSTVAVQPGGVYVIRSRELRGGCSQYAKAQVLDANPAAGTVRVRVATNQNCNDPRLVAED